MALEVAGAKPFADPKVLAHFGAVAGDVRDAVGSLRGRFAEPSEEVRGHFTGFEHHRLAILETAHPSAATACRMDVHLDPRA